MCLKNCSSFKDMVTKPALSESWSRSLKKAELLSVGTFSYLCTSKFQSAADVKIIRKSWSGQLEGVGGDVSCPRPSHDAHPEWRR